MCVCACVCVSECVCVCVCVRERERQSVGLNRANREGSLHTIMVHFFFFPSSSGCLRVIFEKLVRRESTYFCLSPAGGLY